MLVMLVEDLEGMLDYDSGFSDGVSGTTDVCFTRRSNSVVSCSSVICLRSLIRHAQFRSGLLQRAELWRLSLTCDRLSFPPPTSPVGPPATINIGTS